MTREERILGIVEGTDKGFAPYYDVIPKLIRERSYRKGIEIGVFAGGHAKAILDNSNLQLLIGIDPYKMYKTGGASGEIKDQEDFDCMYSFAMSRLKFDRYVHLRLTSDEAFSSLESTWGKFDFVFIDGLHTHDQIKRDLRNYNELIRKGGVIVCHDYNYLSYPGIVVAIDFFAKEHNAEIITCPLDAIYMEKTWE